MNYLMGLVALVGVLLVYRYTAFTRRARHAGDERGVWLRVGWADHPCRSCGWHRLACCARCRVPSQPTRVVATSMARPSELQPIVALHFVPQDRRAPRPSSARAAVGDPFGLATLSNVVGMQPPDQEPGGKRADH